MRYEFPRVIELANQALKLLERDCRILVLDEPTAVLTPQEVDDVFVIFRQMAADGHALIFISHKLHEIFALTDRVTVLRDGKVIGTRMTAEVTKADLAQMMVGREVLLERVRPPIRRGTGPGVHPGRGSGARQPAAGAPQ